MGSLPSSSSDYHRVHIAFQELFLQPFGLVVDGRVKPGHDGDVFV
jgi:hypothetical protein